MAGTISSDTTIDADHPESGTGLIIADGTEGPTTVKLVDGGVAVGAHIEGNSTLIVDGGAITYLSRIEGNGSLIINSGTVSCLSDPCEYSDYPYFLRLHDHGSLRLLGASDVDEVMDSIALYDDSTATFVGTNLSIVESSPAVFEISGTLVDGSLLQTSVSLLGIDSNPTGRIFLVEVPEASSLFQCSFLLIGLLGLLWYQKLGLSCH